MEKELSKMSWRADQMFTLGVVELVCNILYLIPKKSFLGAIFLTGYLGAATAPTGRINDSRYSPGTLGMRV